MPWRLIGAAAGVLAFAAAIVGSLWKAHSLGHAAGVAESAVVLEAWKRQVVEQAVERREAQQARFNDLQGRFDELRQRPERVRTVVRRVEVRADDICGSLPHEWMRVWNADADSVRPIPAATAAAGLDDASRVAVADAAAVAAEARERFETNAARLTALQTYIRSVVLHESENTK